MGMRNAAHTAQNHNELIRLLAQTAHKMSPDILLWYMAPDEQGGHRALALSCTEQATLWETISKDAVRLLQSGTLQSGIACTTCTDANNQSLLAAAFSQPGEMFEGFLAVCESTAQQTTAQILSQMTLARTFGLEHLEKNQVVRQTEAYRKITQLLNLTSNVDDIAEAYIATVNFFREVFGLQLAAIVSKNGDLKKYRVEAVSDIDKLDSASELGQTLLALAKDAFNADETVEFSVDSVDHPLGPESHELIGLRGVKSTEAEHWQRRFCHLTSSHAGMCVPLELSDNRCVCLVLAAPDGDGFARQSNAIQSNATSIGNQLRLIDRSQRGALSISLQWFSARLRNNMTRTVGIVCCVLALLMLVPAPYVLRCDTQLQPGERRFVAAPFDSVLKRCSVKDGDIVEQGDLLAELDGRQLRLELAGLEADLQRQEKKRDSAIASNDYSDSQIASLEIKRLTAEIQIAHRRLENLEIRAPIAGVIISGDLSEMEGAPLETGQSMFEIGPLDCMQVEVEIPEEEVRYVQAGQPVKIMLDAFPFESWNGTLLHIHTRSELRQDKSVFIGEVELDNRSDMLRPGMQGRCRIRTDWHPLGWNLFHRPMENVRGWLIW